MDWNKLTAQVQKAEYVNDTDAELLNKLQTNTVDTVVDISVHDIQQYLMLTGKLLGIESGSSTACIEAVRAMSLFTTFRITDSIHGASILAKLTSILVNLVAETATPFIEADKLIILGLGIRTETIEESLHQGVITDGQINHARSL